MASGGSKHRSDLEGRVRGCVYITQKSYYFSFHEASELSRTRLVGNRRLNWNRVAVREAVLSHGRREG